MNYFKYKLSKEEWINNDRDKFINLFLEHARVFDALDFVAGEHVWNFADFKTKEGVKRFRGNRKGVFTKDRNPKLVAHYLKERWGK